MLSGLHDLNKNIFVAFVDFVCANIASSCKCHGTTLHFDWKLLRETRLINMVPRRMLTARCGAATPNHLCELSLPRQRWKGINASRGSGVLVAVRICSMLVVLCNLSSSEVAWTSVLD